MAKRFFDTKRIDEEWYLALPLKHRELLRYCESKCDNAGVFVFSEKVATVYIGEKITAKDLLKLPDIVLLPNGKYFMLGFLREQNGKISTLSPAQKPIFASITDNKLDRFIDVVTLLSTLPSTLSDALPGREQEKDIETEEELKEDKESPLKQKMATLTKELVEFIPTYGKEMIRDFFDYWAEPNHTKTKMRFEMEKTWDLGKRLQRWKNNNFNNTTNKPTTSSEAAKALFE